MQYARGRVRRPDADHQQVLSHQRHGRMLQGIKADPLPTSFDATSYYGPIKNQEQCGSCWLFSANAMIEAAYAAAGIAGVILSEEYFLSCQRSGGCNGDDNTTVLAIAKSTGLPLTSDYGPYTARRGTCNYKAGQKLYKVNDWGYADSIGNTGQNVTSTPDIKASLFKYKNIGCAVAAGGDQFWDTGLGTGVANSNQIDHDVDIAAWDDNHDNGDGTKGAWKVRNHWGTQWGYGGWCWIKYGAYSIGTESVWSYVTPVNPPIDSFV